MAELCNCNSTFSNTGLPNCDSLQKVTKGIIVVPTFDSTGARNYIDPTDTLDAAFWTALINETDGTKRYFPIQNLKNITSERADPIFEAFEDLTKNYIHQNIRSFKGLIPRATPTFQNQLESGRCTKMSIFIIDADGSLWGKQMNDDGFLYPIEINEQSWYPKYIPATDTTQSKIELGFDYGVNERDADLRMIKATSFTDLSLLNLTGLLDITATFTGITTAGFTMKLATNFGAIGDPVLATGFLIANFFNSVGGTSGKLRRTNNTPADVTITSVTESTDTPGTYAVVIPTATAADELRVTLKKNGYGVEIATLTIPA